VDAVGVGSEGDRAYTQLGGEFLGRRGAIDEQRAGVRRDAGDGNAPCASADLVAGFENGDVQS
jgi:hypothetical protein